MVFEVKSIMPKINLNPKVFKDDMDKRNKKIQSQIRRDITKTVSTWKKKPKISVKKKVEGDSITYTVRIDSEKWGWIDKGTKPYTIYPKASNTTGKLWFRVPNSPKSQPGILKSGQGGLIKDTKLVAVDSVDHPGIKARGWTKIILRRYSSRVVDEGNDALRKWMQNSTRPAGRNR